MTSIDERYRGFFRAVRAFNRQPEAVRGRVVVRYFDLAARGLPPGAARDRLRLYGLRAARTLSRVRGAV